MLQPLVFLYLKNSMLNLLPKDHSDSVRREYLRRMAIVVLVGLFFVDIFLLVAIFPTYTSLNMRKQIEEQGLKSIKESSKTKDTDLILGNIKDLETRLKTASIVSGDLPTDYIDKILSLRGAGIYIQSISYVKKSNTQKDIAIEATASSRANLIDFSKKLKASSWATSSDIPLSNLASDKNIKFFVTLTATSTLR